MPRNEEQKGCLEAEHNIHLDKVHGYMNITTPLQGAWCQHISIPHMGDLWSPKLHVFRLLNYFPPMNLFQVVYMNLATKKPLACLCSASSTMETISLIFPYLVNFYLQIWDSTMCFHTFDKEPAFSGYLVMNPSHIAAGLPQASTMPTAPLQSIIQLIPSA